MRAPATFLVLVIFLFSLAACDRGGPAEEEVEASAAPDSSAVAKAGDGEDAEEPDPAVPVEISVVQAGPIETLIRSTATLEAESQVIVAAEAARRVVEIVVEEGDRVRRGALLLRLQDDEQRSAVSKAQTQLDQAQREWDRQERLYEQKLTTEKAYNDALAALEQRRLEFADAERALGYTQVRAPITGTVTQRFVKIGDQVNIGAQLFEVIDFESLVALLYVPEKEIGALKVGQATRLFATAVSDGTFDAKVMRVSPIVDARTGTVKVTIDVGGQKGLRPGLYVDVELVTAVEPDAILVPKRAVIYENDQMYAFKVSGETVDRVRLVPRMIDRTHVYPLQGIAVGDSLVTAGQAGLKDGARVEIVQRGEGGDAE